MSGEGGAKRVGSVANAVRLMQVLGEAGTPLGVTAAARAAGVNPSSALHILRTLTHEGLVSFDDRAKTYWLGLGLLPLARALLGQQEIDLIRPELMRLATAHECLFALWQFADERVILIDRALATTPVRLDIEVTRRMPAFIGAIGRAYAAACGLGREALKERFGALRWQQPITFEAYLESVEEARAKGYAVDRETIYAGINTAAAVVPRGGDTPTLGISAIGLSSRLDEARLTIVGEELARLCANVGTPAPTLKLVPKEGPRIVAGGKRR